MESGRPKKEKHPHHDRRDGLGDSPEGTIAFQFLAGHPAAADAIKKQVSLQRPSKGNVQASAEKRGTLVTGIVTL